MSHTTNVYQHSRPIPYKTDSELNRKVVGLTRTSITIRNVTSEENTKNVMDRLKKRNETILQEANKDCKLIRGITCRVKEFFHRVTRRNKLENLATSRKLDGDRLRGRKTTP